MQVQDQFTQSYLSFSPEDAPNKKHHHFARGFSGNPPSESLLHFIKARIKTAMDGHGYEPAHRIIFTQSKLAQVKQMDETEVAGILLMELPPTAFHQEL